MLLLVAAALLGSCGEEATTDAAARPLAATVAMSIVLLQGGVAQNDLPSTPAELAALRDLVEIQDAFALRDASGAQTEIWTLVCKKDPSGALAKLVWSPLVIENGQLASDVDVQMPFHLPGGCVQIGNSKSFLVSGLKQGASGDESYLCRVSLVDTPTRTIQIVEAKAYVGGDYQAVAFNPIGQRIWVVDTKNNSVHAATWPSFGTALPAALPVIANAQNVPELANDRPMPLPMPASAHGGIGLILAAENRSIHRTELTQVGGGWVATQLSSATPSLPTWLVSDRNGIDALRTFQVSVAGPPAGTSTFCVISLLDGLIVAAHQHPGDGAKVGYASPSEFFDAPGHPYVLATKVGSVQTSAVIQPVMRYGKPMNSADLLVAEFAIPNDAEVDDEDYALAIEFEFAAAPPASGQTAGRLLLAIRSGPTDPIIDLGNGHALLDTQSYIDFQVDKKADEPYYDESFPLPIPNDQGLDHVVFLCQFLYVDQLGGLTMSNVSGTTIFPKGGTQLAVSISTTMREATREQILRQRSAQRTAGRSATAQAAFSRWVRGLKAGHKKSKGRFDVLLARARKRSAK